MLRKLTARPLGRWSASVLAGGLLVLSAPIFPLPFLAWVCLVPALFAAIDAESDQRSFLHGLGTGFLFSVLTFHWLIGSLSAFMGLSRIAAPVFSRALPIRRTFRRVVFEEYSNSTPVRQFQTTPPSRTLRGVKPGARWKRTTIPLRHPQATFPLNDRTGT